MDLSVPLVVASIIDHGVLGSNTGIIWRSFFILIILAAAGMGFSFTAQWFSAKAAVGTATEMRQALFDHIQHLSYVDLDSIGTDTLITRMTSDINQIQTAVNYTLRLALRSPFIVFGAMIMAFTIDKRCAAIFAVAIPALALVVYLIMSRSIPLFKKTQSALDRLLENTRENLTGVRVIRAFCKEDSQISEFDNANSNLTDLSERVGRLSALMNPMTYLLINLAAIVLIRNGAVRVNSGALSQGSLVALYNYMAQITVELVKLATLISMINKGIACAERTEQVMNHKPSQEYAEDMKKEFTALPDAPAVKMKNVCFTYQGAGDEAVSDISFEIERGRTVGIIGGTGSGKTTVVNLIPRFYDATAGTVMVFGHDVKTIPENILIQKIGVVPQKAELFEGTIRDNLQLGKKDATDAELWKALEAAQISEFVQELDMKLDSPVEQYGRNFSGGQRQRLTIARALVRQPEILIMDDSASALDFATDLKLRKAIHAFSGRITVFIVSQRAASVRNADRILVLDDGKLVGMGKHDELMRTCNTYQEIYYSQFPKEEEGYTLSEKVKREEADLN